MAGQPAPVQKTTSLKNPDTHQEKTMNNAVSPSERRHLRAVSPTAPPPLNPWIRLGLWGIAAMTGTAWGQSGTGYIYVTDSRPSVQEATVINGSDVDAGTPNPGLPGGILIQSTAIDAGGATTAQTAAEFEGNRIVMGSRTPGGSLTSGLQIYENQTRLGLYDASGNQTRGLLVREGVPGGTDTNLLLGTTAITGALSMQNNAITDVADGVDPTDAVNKRQLDAVAAQASAGWGVSANGGAVDTIAPGQTVNVNNGTNTAVTYDAASNTLRVHVVDNPSFSGEVGANGGLNVADHLTIEAGTNVQIGNNQVHGVAAGTAATDAVNKAQLDTVADTPITFGGNTGSHETRLGETFNIVGGSTTAGSYSGNNVRTVVTGNQVQIQMADAPEFSGMVSAQGGLSVGAGSSVDMGGNRVQNVAAGTAGTDAVNVDQMQAGDAATLRAAKAHADAGDARTLRRAQAYADTGDARTLEQAQAYADTGDARTLDTSVQYTNAQIASLRKEAFAGIAQAAAMVPMAPSADGETTLNAGVASYGGQTAVGVAFARQIGRVTLNGGIGASGGKRNLVRLGAGWRF
ncbi:hypothetical protein GCM10007935_21760 [Hydrogenophaga electricum]|uniref:Trimeric autotransporter adhesin YadA-like C-terminal membrane anchor domain-containing protein n=1 Tax=Hydrogenophaga electricum TaxID=1230953 RepID=A0ABQ6C6V6_9BURK|nr:hypothetical protein GCM10007935_21760 [Hydrogenophaga electricum]